MDARMGVSTKGNPGRMDGGVAGSLFVTLSFGREEECNQRSTRLSLF